MTKPFFRADQVGSLLRPPELIAARTQFQQGSIDKAQLRAAEDAAIAQIVLRQEACGFEVVVDGEFRRENWWIDFVQGLSGVEIREGDVKQAFVAPTSQKPMAEATVDAKHGGDHGHDHDHDHAWKYVPKNVVTTGRLTAAAPITSPDFSYLQSVTQRAAKVTLPSPTRLHFHGGRSAVSTEAYPDIEAFYADGLCQHRGGQHHHDGQTSGASWRGWWRCQNPFGNNLEQKFD